MSGRMRIGKWTREALSYKKQKPPTPKSKLYTRDGLKTIFHTLEDAIEEGKKWEDIDSPFPIITLEKNGYYRFYGHGQYAYKNGHYFDV